MGKFQPEDIEQNIERLLKGLSSAAPEMDTDFRARLKDSVRQQVQGYDEGGSSWGIWGFWLRRGVALLAAMLLLVMAYFFFTVSETELATLAVRQGEVHLQRSISVLGWDYPIAYTVATDEGFLLRENDQLRLNEDTFAQISFFDKSLIELDPATELSIQTLQPGTGQSGSPTEIVLALQNGRTVSRVESVVNQGSRFEIKTPAADVTVQGTIFRTTAIDKNQTHVGTDEGVVTLQLGEQNSAVPAGFEVTAVTNQSLAILPQPPTLQIGTTLVSPAQRPQTPTPLAAANRPIFLAVGQALPASQVRLFLDDQLLDTVTTDNLGLFQYEFTVSQEGQYRLTGQTVLQNSIESRRSAELEICYDTTPPSLSIISPTTPQVSEEQITLVGQTEAGVRVTVNQTPVEVDAQGQFSLPLTLNPGQNSIDIVATDLAGNAQQSISTLTLQ